MTAYANVVDFINGYYEDIFGDQFGEALRLDDVLRKIDDPALSSDTGMGTAAATAGIFYSLVYDAKVFSLLPLKQLTGEKVKIITTDEATTGGIAEAAALADSDVPTFAEYTFAEKEVMSRWQFTDKAERMTKYRAGAVSNADFAEYFRVRHPRAIEAMLLKDSNTLAGYNFESLDRLISSYAEIAGNGYTAGDSDPYTEAVSGINRDSAGSTVYDSQVLEYDSTPQALTLTKIETLIEQTRTYGADPARQVFVTGQDTYRRWKALVSPGQRFGEWQGKKTLVNGIESAAGADAGLELRSWDGTPIVVLDTTIMPKEADEASRILLLDLEHISFWMSVPTTVMTSDNRVANDFLGVDNIVLTCGELICTRFCSQGKIRDIL
jgi:hypothetical protein